MIQANQVSTSYGDRRVLRNLDLTLQKGEVVALVGLNGAGKTTLIRTLCGLIKPDSGSISMDGSPTSGSANEFRQNIGVVLHASMFYQNLTSRENLEFYARLYDLPSARQRVSELLDLMDLKSRAHDRVGTLSKGLQQRLSVARALLHDPTYLLFDEVFSGLDQQFLSRIIELIHKESAAGKGILISTHDLEKVFLAATRVDILHKGNIAFSANVDELTPQLLLEKYDELTNASSQSYHAFGRVL